MATTNPKIQLSGLARRLVQDGLLEEEKAENAITESRKSKTQLVSYLVEKKILNGQQIAEAASHEFGVPLLDINSIDLEAASTFIKMVDERLIRKHRAVPLLKRGNRLFIAISDPTNLQALDEIKFNTGINTDAVVVVEEALNRILEKALEAKAEPMEGLLDEDLDNLSIEGGDDIDHKDDEEDSDIDDTPVVRFVNKVLLDAINKGASDIHFEAYEKSYRVRFRQDGILHEIASPPLNMASRVTARIKVMSRMDIAERRVPQDGRIKMNISKTRAIDFRVNTCPTLFGEKIVLRILDSSAANLNIDVLGYEDHQKKLFMDAIHKPWGLVLVTGPTGSGKTVSLYTALSILNTADKNISTAEDPVEINLQGINQVHMNAKTGMNFSLALRAFLRQDPDIIMVGEIRDLETAEISIKAAQTGHLVLSTLHTNDAPQTLTRLINMGIPPFNIASAISLIIAQRLARKLCSQCKKEEKIPEGALLKEGFKKEEIGTFKIYGPVGCDQCTNGYKGRVGVYQVMPVSEETGRIIMEGGNALQIADQAAKEGINDLRRSGLNKVKEGITSLEEINRITKD
ncbi:MAG TPA: type IV-A pilus assembly ATPase PilB [Gammaproteobacteria bacterium]|nr:type IV-A pilus assembly ATPase PilB [Gammaproteobacteria bacterium]